MASRLLQALVVLLGPAAAMSPRVRHARRVDVCAQSLQTFRAPSWRGAAIESLDAAAARVAAARLRASDKLRGAYLAAKRAGVAPSFDSAAAALDRSGAGASDDAFERATGLATARFSPAPVFFDERRIHTHEAGHLLAAYALGVPAVDATLSRVDAFFQNKPNALGAAAPASAFADGALREALTSGRDGELVDRYAVVLLAGVAAEAVVHGDGKLGAHDDLLLKGLVNAAGGDYASTKRAALARALEVLEARRPALDRLRAHLADQRGRSIGETMLCIDDEAYAPAPRGVAGARRELTRRLAPLGLTLFATPALAASDWPEFDAIRAELAGGGTGGLAFMRQKIESRDFAPLREFTKEWDLEFRKAVLGKARKAMPKGPDRDRAVLVANAVTFDLIGINKAIRAVGSEDAAEARRWYDILVDDISDFLTLEPRGARPVAD